MEWAQACHVSFFAISLIDSYYLSRKSRFRNDIFAKTAFETYKPMGSYSELYGIIHLSLES